MTSEGNLKKEIPIKVIVDAIEETADGWEQFYNTVTGEVESVPDDDNDFADMSEFEEIAEKIEDSDDYVRLPSQYELHEYSIMERFAEAKDNAVLMRALRGQSMRGGTNATSMPSSSKKGSPAALYATKLPSRFFVLERTATSIQGRI